MPDSDILTDICRIFIFAIPTFVIYFMICYSPYMSAKLIGTAFTDVLTNLLHGLSLSLLRHSYDKYFMVFILIFYIIILFIKFHTAHVFLLQLVDSPPKRNFKQAMQENIGNPPTIRFVEYKTPSCPPSSSNSQQNSRMMSPVNFEYDTWQDLTPYPELKYAECLKVTTATNCVFTDNAQKEIEKRRRELQKNVKPHHYITTSIQSNNSTDYFESNTSGKQSKTLKILTSKPALGLYYVLVVFGYRLGFEYFYYSAVRDYKVQMYKCIGVKGDNLRAKSKQIDKTAQNNFSMYLKAADSQGIIS